ncbi:TetR/AcrR family transcriptional regulator, partial [Micromonospora sp. D75]|nr:TetR/AcrR family transcriptional regulator [Micromonospora sp. D75]
GGRQVPKAEAEALVAALSWRGIASFPLQGESA